MTILPYKELLIGRLPEGGFVVSALDRPMGPAAMLFAANDIDTALAYIAEKLTAEEPE